MFAHGEAAELSLLEQRGQPIGYEPPAAVTMLDPARASADDGGIQRTAPRAFRPLIGPSVDPAPTEGFQIAFLLDDRVNPPTMLKMK